MHSSEHGLVDESICTIKWRLYSTQTTSKKIGDYVKSYYKAKSEGQKKEEGKVRGGNS
jgi:hypothetical protein